MNTHVITITREIEKQLPRNVEISGRVGNLLHTKEHVQFRADTLRLFFQDKDTGAVQFILDVYDDIWAKVDDAQVAYLAKVVTLFFRQQRATILSMNPHKVSTVVGKKVAAVCPICRGGLAVFAVLGWGHGAFALEVAKIGCACFYLDSVVLSPKPLGVNTCFYRRPSIFGGTPSPITRTGDEVEGARNLLDWANVLVGICRAAGGGL